MVIDFSDMRPVYPTARSYIKKQRKVPGRNLDTVGPKQRAKTLKAMQNFMRQYGLSEPAKPKAQPSQFDLQPQYAGYLSPQRKAELDFKQRQGLSGISRERVAELTAKYPDIENDNLED